jgi:hypothetical protein
LPVETVLASLAPRCVLVIEEVEIRRMLLHSRRNLTGIFEMEALLQRPEAGPTVLVQADHFP